MAFQVPIQRRSFYIMRKEKNNLYQKFTYSVSSLFRSNKQTSYGFSLLELLIVISIIGILAGLLMVNFVNIRQRGRDAQRKSNLRQIQAALELYRSDIGSYPTSLSSSATTCGPGSWMTANGTTYMSTIPCDPNGGAYFYSGGASAYILAACLENANDSDGTTQVPSGYTGSCTFFFTVVNP